LRRTSFSFSSRQADLLFSSDLDSLNSQELPPETLLARRRPGTSARLEVRDERDREVSDEFLSPDGNGIACAPCHAVDAHHDRAGDPPELPVLLHGA
jgi:hypothetical protein